MSDAGKAAATKPACTLCGFNEGLFVLRGHEDDPLCASCHDRMGERLKIVYRPRTQEGVLRRWPNVVGHLICESLGYFTPRSAANAVLFSLAGEPFSCEWYTHLFGWERPDLVKGGREVLLAAIRRRHSHSGYMCEFKRARQLVRAELEGKGPILASWF